MGFLDKLLGRDKAKESMPAASRLPLELDDRAHVSARRCAPAGFHLTASRVADDVPEHDDAERHADEPRHEVTHRTSDPLSNANFLPA